MLESRKCWDFNKVLSVKTIREFDEHFTAPQFGFSSSEEYYTAAQVTPEIHKFSIPVIGLNAIDDPMQPGEGSFHTILSSYFRSMRQKNKFTCTYL
jgi:predicted alpha/beta-fold hydrolase